MSQSRFTKHSFGTAVVGSLIAQTSTLNVETITVNSYIANGDDSGSVFVLGHTSGTTFTLPPVATSEGFNVEVFVGRTAASHVIVAPTTTIVGGLSTPTAGSVIITPKTSISIGSTALVGDRYRFICDGTRYYLSGLSGTTGSFTIA